jgi:hypothetical protein
MEQNRAGYVPQALTNAELISFANLCLSSPAYNFKIPDDIAVELLRRLVRQLDSRI